MQWVNIEKSFDLPVSVKELMGLINRGIFSAVGIVILFILSSQMSIITERTSQISELSIQKSTHQRRLVKILPFR